MSYDAVGTLVYDKTAYSTHVTDVPFKLDRWYLQFPRPQMASVVSTSETSAKISMAFADCAQSISFVWDTIDTYSHPLSTYDAHPDYTSFGLDFTVVLSSNLKTFDENYGLVLTIDDNSGGSHFIRLWNYKVSGSNTAARFVLNFNAIRQGFAADAPFTPSDVRRMFVTFTHKEFELGTKKAAYDYASATITINKATGVLGYTRPKPGVMYGTQMTMGYDDLYHQNPKRIVEEIKALGYKGFCTCYIGMSHLMKLGWDGARFRYSSTALPINDSSRAWLKDMHDRCTAAGLKFVFSMSYEMLTMYVPDGWSQKNIDGGFATTGWVPSSTVMAFTNADVMTYLKSMADDCMSIPPAGSPKYFQVGEPWWWDGSYNDGKPCFYDASTVAAFQAEKGHGMYQFHQVTDDTTSSAAEETLAWLNQKLGQSVLDILNYVKGRHSGVIGMLLFFTPQAFATPLTVKANYAKNSWKSPNLDVLQLESYDTIVEGDFVKHKADLTAVMLDLAYPASKVQYFAGFVLSPTEAAGLWPSIFQAMHDASTLGIRDIAIWSFSQIVRDGLVTAYAAGVPADPVIGAINDRDVWLQSFSYADRFEQPAVQFGTATSIGQSIGSGIVLTAAKKLSITASKQTFLQTGTVIEPPTITITPLLRNLSGPPSYSVIDGSASLTFDGDNAIVGYATMGSDSVTVKATAGGYEDQITIVKIASGSTNVAAFLTNESESIICDSVGTIMSYIGASGDFRVFEGAVERSLECKFSVVSNPDNVLITIDSRGHYALLGAPTSVSNTTITFQASYKGVTYNRTFKIIKLKAAAGSAADPLTVTGPDGDRLPVEITIPITTLVWDDAAASAALVTYGGAILNDIVTEYNLLSGFKQTRFYAYTGWQTLDARIDGNLLVRGTVGVDALSADAVFALTGTFETVITDQITAAKADIDSLVAGQIDAINGNFATLTVGGTQILPNSINTGHIVDNAVNIPLFLGGWAGGQNINAGETIVVGSAAVTYPVTTKVAIVCNWSSGNLGAATNSGIRIKIDGYEFAVQSDSHAANFTQSHSAAFQITVADGTHTYSVELFNDWANGTIQAGRWSVLVLAIMK